MYNQIVFPLIVFIIIVVLQIIFWIYRHKQGIRLWCPNCGQRQTGLSTQCPKCGVVFKEWKE